MSVTIKTPEQIEKMRIAGSLAADVLEMIVPHVKPGVTTEELDALCHDHIVNVQKAIPANVGYKGFPKTICTSVNHVICHGIPNPGKVLKDGDIVNIDVTVIKDGWHGDTSRMYYVGKPDVLRAAPVHGHLRGDDARHRTGAPRRDARRYRPCDPEACRRQRLFGRARILRPRHRPDLPRGSASAALRPPRCRACAWKRA